MTYNESGNMKALSLHIALLVCFVLGSALPAQAQQADTTSKEVDILNADSLAQFERNNLRIRELTGNVRLLQDDVFLWADRVTQYLSLDEILLIGDVLIVQENDSLFADSVRYFTHLKEGIAQGNVRLSDGEVQVFAPSARHFTDQKYTIFNQNVRLIDSLTVLTSRNGEYFSDDKRAEFFGDVVLEENRTYLEADSVTYYRETEISLGYGDVFIERIGEEEGARADSTTRTFLFGEYAYNDNRSGYSKIENNVLLLQVREDSTGSEVDSLVMKASMMEAIREDSLQRLIAIDSVQIWQQEFAAVADSAVYDRISREAFPLHEENRLFKAPMAWFDTYQVSGDTLRATARDGQIDTLRVRQNAFAAYEDTTTMRINQLTGQHLTGLFEQDSLKSLTVGPQAESIYFRKNSENDQLGATKTSGDRIRLLFEGNELASIRGYSGIQGAYYDGGLIPEPFELTGFQWIPERRPSKMGLLQDRRRLDRLHKLLDKDQRISTRQEEGPLPLRVAQENDK